MVSAAAAPGLRFEVVPPAAEPSPLRSDVAGFLGRTRRGPLGEAVRVEEWRDFERLYGGLDGAADTPYAVRSYFENGGQVAYVVRLAGSGTAPASRPWPQPGGRELPGHRHPATGPAESQAFLHGAQALGRIRVRAATAGSWASGARVRIDYRRRGAGGFAEVDFETRIDGEPPEVLRSLPAADADRLRERLGQLSRFLRLELDLASLRAPAADPGPNRLSWEVTLSGGADDPPGQAEYLAGVTLLSQVPQVAILALPDLYRDLPYDFGGSSPEPASFAVLRAAIAEAERRHDRLVLVDLPADPRRPERPLDLSELSASLDAFDALLDPAERRAAAVYHPRLWVSDPLGGVARPRRLIPPSGPVAGLISRLDRERGAHHTPANAALFDAVDLGGSFDASQRGRLNERGVNLIRCFPNRGLTVWGGRTLHRRPDGRFVAHRRLIHRLVRAIRRVAEPLVFDPDGPELWFTLVRAITSVLLEAFRAGALKGARPEEGFRVRCDEETNPPEERERGRVHCEIELAPAVPMEFITLRVALGREGELEVFES